MYFYQNDLQFTLGRKSRRRYYANQEANLIIFFDFKQPNTIKYLRSLPHFLLILHSSCLLYLSQKIGHHHQFVLPKNVYLGFLCRGSGRARGTISNSDCSKSGNLRLSCCKISSFYQDDVHKKGIHTTYRRKQGEKMRKIDHF